MDEQVEAKALKWLRRAVNKDHRHWGRLSITGLVDEMEIVGRDGHVLQVKVTYKDGKLLVPFDYFELRVYGNGKSYKVYML